MSLLLTHAGPSSPSSGPPITTGLLAQWDFGLADNLRSQSDGSGSPVADADEIKWVRDLSVNANHLTLQTASGPTWGAGLYNGRGAAKFDGAQALTAINNLGNGTSAVTIFAVGARTGATIGLGNVCVGGVPSFSSPGGAWFGTSDVGSFWKLEASGSPIDYTSTLPYDSRLRVFDWAYENGVARLVRGDGVTLTAAPGAAYAIADGKFFIGGWNTNFVRANVCAVLAYNRALSESECAAVELYLANLYGIYLPGVTWPDSYSAIQAASAVAGQINAHMIGGASDPLRYDFDAENVDELGTNNAALTDGQTIATWNNLGSASGNATQATDANRPTLQKNLQTGNDAVTFGGNADILTVGSSQADLGFIHATNDFDIFAVVRKDLASRQVIFSSTDLASESGFVLDFDSNGKGHIKITKGGGVTVNDRTMAAATPVGEVVRVEAYGDISATGIRVDDMAAAGSLLNSVGAGNATNDASIGALASTASGSFDGTVFILLVYNKRIPPTQREAIHTYLAQRFGQ